MSYQTILEKLDLSPNEAKIYEFLVEHGESSVSKIAIGSSIHRRNAYDAIRRLIDKGLVFQIISAEENLYNAVDPDKLLELSQERHHEIENILPDLRKKFHNRVAAEEAYIHRGFEGQRNIWRDILRVGEDSYSIGAKGGWYDPALEASRKAFFKEANRKKIKFLQLFDAEVKIQAPDYQKNFEGELKYRFLPKEYSTNSAINIFGDYVVTYAGLGVKKMNEHTVFFVIQSRGLAESYRKWFWYMWDRSSPTSK